MAAWMPEFEDALGPEQRLELRLRYRGTVVIDTEQLQTALVNLLANARDASDMNAGIVLESSRAERGGVAGCRIAVIDHGEGMTDEVARQAVAPFFTTRQPGKGMGLGLDHRPDGGRGPRRLAGNRQRLRTRHHGVD